MLDEVHAQQQGPDGVVELLPERERFGVRRVPKIGTFLVQDPGMSVDFRFNLRVQLQPADVMLPIHRVVL